MSIGTRLETHPLPRAALTLCPGLGCVSPLGSRSKKGKAYLRAIGDAIHFEGWGPPCEALKAMPSIWPRRASIRSAPAGPGNVAAGVTGLRASPNDRRSEERQPLEMRRQACLPVGRSQRLVLRSLGEAGSRRGPRRFGWHGDAHRTTDAIQSGVFVPMYIGTRRRTPRGRAVFDAFVRPGAWPRVQDFLLSFSAAPILPYPSGRSSPPRRAALGARRGVQD